MPSGELWKETEAGETSPVGLFPEGESPYRCLDMSGNVWEWVQDWYGERYYRKSPKRYPRGPQKGEYRVVRGGSWANDAWYLRVSSRFRLVPGNRYDGIGFRCAV
jgi:sulfatase modifying factor 1